MKPQDLAQSLDLPKRADRAGAGRWAGQPPDGLTDRRAKPAVYFGGKFRIIDFACRTA
jgi:glucose-1-phosphate adenylyltransferase